MRAPILVALALLTACEAAPEPFETRVTLLVDEDNNPLADAATITLRLRLGDGTVVEDTANVEGTELRLEGLSPGDVLSLDVEVRGADNAISGLGRSQAFTLGSEGLQAAVFVGAADSLSRVPDSLSAARTFAHGAHTPAGRIIVVGGGDNVDETIAPVEFVGWYATDPLVALGGADLPRIGHQVVYVPEGTGDWGGQVAVFGGTHGTGDDTLDGGWDNPATSIALVDPIGGGVDDDAGALRSGYMDSRAVQTSEGLFALLGGYNSTGPSNLRYTEQIILVDPAAGAQIDGPTLPAGTNREQHAAVAFSAQGEDYVLMTGGYVDGGGGYVTRDVLWSGRESDEPMALPRTDSPARARHQATDLGTGQVLITGGAAGLSSAVDDGEPVDTAEIFDPVRDGGSFEPVLNPLGEARQRHTAARIPGGRVLLCGGEGVDGALLTSCEVFSIDTRRFEPFGASLTPGGPGIEAIPAGDGRVYFVGGASELGPSDALHVYTPPRWEDE